MSFISRRSLLVVPLLLIPLLAGCDAPGGGTGPADREDRSGGSDRISYPRPSGERDRDRNTAPAARVPGSAELIQQWQGDRLAFTPTRTGTIYVLDADTGALVYSGRIERGDRFLLDRAGNRATLDGQVVFDRQLTGLRSYHVYFDRD